MGIFSFLKKSGPKDVSKVNKGPAMDDAAVKASRIRTMERIVNGLGITVKALSLDLNDDVVTVYGETASQSDKEKVVLALGNLEGIATVDDRITVVVPEPPAVFYEVKSGDTLSKIAKAHYGDAMKYTVIFEANRPMLEHPDKIYPGQVLRIPNL